ncbi:hypothetical protein PMAYCL1PPCAC_33055, partial [Pristionchus mayeri]
RRLILSLMIGLVSTQQAAFQTKFENIFSTYLGSNIVKVFNLVAGDVLKFLPYPNMTSHLESELIGFVPPSKYLGAMGMLRGYNNCVQKAGSDIGKAAAGFGTAMSQKAQPNYKKIVDKAKTMKANGKTKEEIRNEGFKIAYSLLTKTFVQSMINSCMTKMTKAEFECLHNDIVKNVLKTTLYNTTYNAAIG